MDWDVLLLSVTVSITMYCAFLKADPTFILMHQKTESLPRHCLAFWITDFRLIFWHFGCKYLGYLYQEVSIFGDKRWSLRKD